MYIFIEEFLTLNILYLLETKNYSRLFPKAVDFVTDGSESNLLFRTVRTANGVELKPNRKPHWSSATRSYRAVWNLDRPEQRSRAEIVKDAIFQKTNFDLLRNIGPQRTFR